MSESSSLVSEQEFGSILVYTFGEMRYISANSLGSVTLRTLVEGPNPTDTPTLTNGVLDSLRTEGVSDPEEILSEKAVAGTLGDMATHLTFIEVEGNRVSFSRDGYEKFANEGVN